MVETLSDLLSQMSNPVAHGTSSEYLESILEKGLGGFTPKRAFSPKRISVCNLKFEDGLLGAYAFAIRGKGWCSDLIINAKRFGGRNVIKRYVASLKLDRSQARKTEIGLWIVGMLYRLKRGRMRGWPTLLVYDIQGKIKTEKAENDIPSDFNVLSPLPKEMLVLILAPVKKYQETRKIISSFGLTVPILPLEIIELEEILNKNS